MFLVLVIGYAGFSTSIVTQIDEKQTEISSATQTVTSQIAMIREQNVKITTGQRNYDEIVTALTRIEEPDNNDLTDTANTEQKIIIEKNAIPNMLSQIIQVIPKQVKVTSIKNTTDKHIVIEAQAGKYDQLGYFRAVLSTEGILTNVKSTSGLRSGDTVTITIEGDLP